VNRELDGEKYDLGEREGEKDREFLVQLAAENNHGDRGLQGRLNDP
jgi:hypothetical protein